MVPRDFDESGLMATAGCVVCPMNAFAIAAIVIIFAAHGYSITRMYREIAHHIDIGIDFDSIRMADINFKNAMRSASGYSHRTHALNGATKRDFRSVGMRVLGCKKAREITCAGILRASSRREQQ
jgi:hypothetical protein